MQTRHYTDEKSIRNYYETENGLHETDLFLFRSFIENGRNRLITIGGENFFVI